ncbi:MAG: UDP-N-acetylmuramoyl-L-alanyl-D-glutamate--2,6-diaminopimelate ligase [Clostridia bacterium]|nr:UDP-N-acetylmuramoyl-L-alanyl-D-glutamate--2,6-diaminopimelate ligase [Clostridia bacterium]
MELKKILNGIENYKAKGNIEIDVLSIEDNSKNVKPGSLFVAVKGFDFDGHKFVDEAISNGATAVILDMNADLKKIKIPEDVTVVIVQDSRIALAVVACNFYGNSSKKFTLIGVTGTKGKTTTCYMIKSILEKAGKKVGLIGTIENFIGEKSLGESDRTTPGSVELQRMFYQMAKEKCDVVVMEVSSQSLKLNRVLGSYFDIGVFTNFSEDHISEKEHPDMEDYFKSKEKLFAMCPKGFVNADDFKAWQLEKDSPKCEFKTYGIDNNCELLAKDVTVTNISVDYKVKIGTKNERIKVNIPGRFSVYNSLAAISVAQELGASIENIKEGLAETQVPGRSEMVNLDIQYPVMIDYAHTVSSLTNILTAVKAYTQGRVICVFGCGGDRDKEKRPLMGEVAGKIADYTIVTTDNPRTEKPEDIVAEIEAGIAKTKGKYEVIVDRKEAIRKALETMNRKDMVVICGKGHEKYQEINKEKFPFDEREIVKEIIEEIKAKKRG